MFLPITPLGVVVGNLRTYPLLAMTARGVYITNAFIINQMTWNTTIYVRAGTSILTRRVQAYRRKRRPEMNVPWPANLVLWLGRLERLVTCTARRGGRDCLRFCSSQKHNENVPNKCEHILMNLWLTHFEWWRHSANNLEHKHASNNSCYQIHFQQNSCMRKRAQPK
jgi:hypothetical protein